MRDRESVCGRWRFGNGRDARARRAPLCAASGEKHSPQPSLKLLAQSPNLSEPPHLTMLSTLLLEKCERFKMKCSELSHVVHETEKWMLLE